MSNENLIRQQARSAYKTAIASHYTFRNAKGIEEATQSLQRQVHRIYQPEDKAIFLDEVCIQIKAEIEAHIPRCSMKEGNCPTEQNMHQLEYSTILPTSFSVLVIDS